MANNRICPECGCPLTDETVCPECGYVLQTGLQSQPAPEPTPTPDPMPYNSGFNEGPEPYSPFSADSWFFRTPSYLAKYPRGQFRLAHPFLGWLFGPWHIDAEKREDCTAIDALNNFFYFCNLWWKMNCYTFVWTLLKLWWMILILVVVGLIISSAPSAFTGFLGSVMMIVVFVVGTVVFTCGIGRAIHRYWGEIYRTFHRMCHRFCNSMYHGMKTNSLVD